jgi:hypothetical protein
MVKMDKSSSQNPTKMLSRDQPFALSKERDTARIGCFGQGVSGTVTPFSQTNLNIQQIAMILAGNISHNILDRNPA